MKPPIGGLPKIPKKPFSDFLKPRNLPSYKPPIDPIREKGGNELKQDLEKLEMF